MPFTDRTLSFLFENKMMDSRQWFKEHRSEYEEFVLNPMAELFVKLTPAMLEIDPEFTCIPQAGKSISRLWRDTRFMKDKSIYRDYIWLNFLREKYAGLPGYYFSVSPMGADWGCGWYWTGTETMENIRSRVLANDPEWLAADEAYRSQSSFVISGEKYKRSPYADKPENQRTWLDQRNISFVTPNNPDIMFSDELPDRLIADFKSIAPIYKFLVSSTVRREHRER